MDRLTIDLPDQRKEIKEICKFFYQAGILLVDGATAVNCNVENFYDGWVGGHALDFPVW